MDAGYKHVGEYRSHADAGDRALRCEAPGHVIRCSAIPVSPAACCEPYLSRYATHEEMRQSAVCVLGGPSIETVRLADWARSVGHI